MNWFKHNTKWRVWGLHVSFSQLGKVRQLRKAFLSRRHPWHELDLNRNEMCYITTVCAWVRCVECGHNTNGLRGYVLLLSAPICMFRQAYGQIWPPSKFQCRSYFTNKVFCTVPGPINTAILLCCFMCKGTCR